jgi:hypothetical protein
MQALSNVYVNIQFTVLRPCGMVLRLTKISMSEAVHTGFDTSKKIATNFFGKFTPI